MVELTFSVNGVKELSRNLRVLASDLKDLKPFFGKAIDIIADRTDKIFKNKGNNVEKGPKRKGLSVSTIEARAKRRGYYKQSPNKPSTLRRTGNLQDNRTKTITNNSGKLTFNANYGGYHQNGGKKLPQRKIIDLDNKTNQLIVKELQKKINDDLKIFGRQI